MYRHIDDGSSSLGANTLMQHLNALRVRRDRIRQWYTRDAVTVYGAYRSIREVVTVFGLFAIVIFVTQSLFLNSSYSTGMVLMLVATPSTVYWVAVVGWCRWGRQRFPLPENKDIAEFSATDIEQSASEGLTKP